MKFLMVCSMVSFFCFANLFAQKTVEFNLTRYVVKEGEKIGIRGNNYPLSWDNSFEMTPADSAYIAVLNFNDSIKDIEYKYVIYDDENLVWENIENRRLSFLGDEIIYSKNKWNTPPLVDINTLELLQPDSIAKDFELISTMILDTHPGTYRYVDSLSIQNSLAELKAKTQKPISHADFYLAVSKVLANIQCDHTFASFYNQDNTWKSLIHYQRNKLPFAFRWIDQKMIVTRDATKNNLFKNGTEIIEINNIPVSKILADLLPYVSSDGATDKSRASKLNVDGFDFRYSNFDVFFTLLYDIDVDNLKLEVKEFGKEISDIVFSPALTLEERNTMLKSRYPEFPESRNDLWHFEITKNNVAILTLNSFGLNGWKSLTIDYKQFFADAFLSIKEKGINRLIIDIRNNTGGSDEIVEELYTYFDVATILKEGSEGRTRFLDFPVLIRNQSTTWGEDPWYYNLKNENPPYENGYYIFPNAYSVNKKNVRKSNFYTGQLYLLTSPANVSLAYYLTKNFKKYKLGTIIGQETGGNLKGINGGQILFLKLPYSGLEVDFPVMGDFTVKSAENKGISPDIELSQDQEAISRSIDKVMETALNIK